MAKNSFRNNEIHGRIYDRVSSLRLDPLKNCPLPEFDGLYPAGADQSIFDLDGRVIGLASWTDNPEETIISVQEGKSVCLYSPLKRLSIKACI